ncbi:uncharacterized protein LOC121412653 [Lytechinus variegatus]|uniref:uncharacterized protein LOC121412653 n=1 Tax=Lytechinus variegatus TaxID=7654 RepID=UPI001BB0EC57|nr:uncharacterized protein LOC121412653 [Lytechinus variegatus]
MAEYDGNIVTEWLRSLDMLAYSQAFLDNGYDELETCKQIGPDDLDAIGVVDLEQRSDLLMAVDRLREEGGTAVYFTLVGPSSDDEGGSTIDELSTGRVPSVDWTGSDAGSADSRAPLVSRVGRTPSMESADANLGLGLGLVGIPHVGYRDSPGLQNRGLYRERRTSADSRVLSNTPDILRKVSRQLHNQYTAQLAENTLQ